MCIIQNNTQEPAPEQEQSQQQSAPRPRRRLGCLGKTLIAIALYFALSAICGLWMGSAFSTPETKLQDNSVYHLVLDGTIVEQGVEDNPFAAFMDDMPGYKPQNSVGLDDILSNIRLARTDNRIKGIYISGDGFDIAPASAKAIRDALLDFRASGKWIVAYGENMDQLNYYIASVADYYYLNPIGSINWHGLAASKMYYKRLLDKLGISVYVYKVGTFKSAVEPYILSSMSEADKKQTRQYLDGIWDELKDGVAQSRHLESKALDALANRYMDLQPAEECIKAGLADTTLYVQDMDSVLRAMTGTKDFHLVTTSAMNNVARDQVSADAQVAVIYADGIITDDGKDGIVAKKMIKTIKKVAKNKSVKAVVFRVNSPGGSAFASEQIWHAMQTLRQQGLPVVVSMGDYAASGGYYISCMADYIIAEPTTITGSIGIFGLVPNVHKLTDKVGLDIDGISTHLFSSMPVDLQYGKPSQAEHQLFQTNVERGYDIFTSRCADGRAMSQNVIKQIAEGRVWLGEDALRLGLVDSLGNVDDAVTKAAGLADVEHYTITYYPERKDFMADLLASFDNTTDEERLIARIRTLCAKPRIMALMPEVTIK